MSFSPGLSSSFNNTKNRGGILSPQSGMCSLCTADCIGTCEIGLSAVLGAQTVYPTTTGNNQIASEKDYPIDYSHFNINGRVFGANGAAPGEDQAAVFGVRLERTIGRHHPVKLAMPVILPALIKLNWPDYFGGAAMAGVPCVIGEGSPSKDPEARFEHGTLQHFPKLGEMLDAFRKYDRGYGQIILQCNCEDDQQGLPEYGLAHHNLTAIEFKFAQSAKGTQPVTRLKDYDAALKKQAEGGLVHPDPSSPEMKQAHKEGTCPNFYHYARLPMWEEDYLIARIAQLRKLGLKNVYFKMAGCDPVDLERVLRIASAAEVDMVTFDGAGGGSGYSPCKMMNEFGLPSVLLQTAVGQIAKKLTEQGLALPAISLTGGFSMEDHVFKALALGGSYLTAVGICRASMAAAMSAAKVGELIQEGRVPPHLAQYGKTVPELFGDLPDLRALYGKDADRFSPGAIGVFSYLNRIAYGLRHFAALNRKFDIDLLDPSDVIPLTAEAHAIQRGILPYGPHAGI